MNTNATVAPLGRITWRGEYSVGIEEIDQQHQTLFALLNRQISDHEMCRDEHEAGQILDELVEYVKFHFREEEIYLRGHKEFSRHQEAHAQFVHDLMILYRRYADGVASVRDELLVFIATWLVDHIVGTDRKDLAKLTTDVM